MGEGHWCHECTRAYRPRRVGFGLANRISRRDYLHQHDPHLTLAGDTRIDERGHRHTPFEIAAVSLRSIQTRRVRNGAEQPRIRPKSSRSQSEMGSARSRRGCRDRAIRWILEASYHRNAGKQSERGVPADLIVSQCAIATERSLSKFTPGAWLVFQRVTAARRRRPYARRAQREEQPQ